MDILKSCRCKRDEIEENTNKICFCWLTVEYVMSNTCEWSSEYEMELNALNPSSLLSNNSFETSKTFSIIISSSNKRFDNSLVITT